MPHRPCRLLAVRPGCTATGSPSVVDTSRIGQVRVERMADGLEEPWGLAFLPDGRFLVTERDGRLSLFSADGGEVLARFDDFPGLVAEGQGGLLDVLVPRDVAQSQEVWSAMPKEQGGRSSGTALAAIDLSPETSTLRRYPRPVRDDARQFRRAALRLADRRGGGRHDLFLTIGDRGTGADGLQAQDPMRGMKGQVVHLDRDGAPAYSPLFGAMACPASIPAGPSQPAGGGAGRRGSAAGSSSTGRRAGTS